MRYYGGLDRMLCVEKGKEGTAFGGMNGRVIPQMYLHDTHVELSSNWPLLVSLFS